MPLACSTGALHACATCKRRLPTEEHALSKPQAYLSNRQTSSIAALEFAYPGQSDVVGVLEGLVAKDADGADAIGRHGDDLQEEHVEGLLKAPAFWLRGMHRPQHAQLGVLGKQQPQHVAVLGPHAPHHLPHLRHRHVARPAPA